MEGFTVNQGYGVSNPRGESISNQELAKQIINLIDFYERNHPDLKQLLVKSKKQLSNTTVKQALSKIKAQVQQKNSQAICAQFDNDALLILLEETNGGLQLGEQFQSLSLDQIEELIDELTIYSYWKHGYVPIAQDNEQSLLIIDDNGQIVNWNRDHGIQEMVEKNLAVYLEKVVNMVLKKQWEYIQGTGMIENV